MAAQPPELTAHCRTQAHELPALPESSPTVCSAPSSSSGTEQTQGLGQETETSPSTEPSTQVGDQTQQARATKDQFRAIRAPPPAPSEGQAALCS